MLIVITGLDGSGTSSIAQKLNELDQGSYLLRTPSPEYADRKMVDTYVRQESSVGHMLYYLSSNVYMSDYIKKHIDLREKDVFLVRYLVDTVVSNRVAGIPIDLDYNIYGNELLEPDLTIFVMVDEKERQKRILSRGMDALDHVLDDESKRIKFLMEYNQLLDPAKTIVVNNSDDLDKVAIETYEKVKKFKGVGPKKGI